MGNYQPNRNSQKDSSSGQGIDYEWTSTRIQNCRSFMMDFTCEELSIGHLQTFSFFCVFQGHLGIEIAWNASQNFSKQLAQKEQFQKLNDGDIYHPEDIRNAIITSILEFDTKMESIINDKEAGCAISGVLITPDHFFFINLGNACSILCREEKVAFNTWRHEPLYVEEYMRITKAGGWIDDGKVNGKVETSRSLGLYQLKRSSFFEQKDQIISPEPDVTVINRNRMTDDGLLISTNGLFNSLSTDELTKYLITRYPYKKSLELLAEEILEYCCYQQTRDNMALIIIKFDQSPLRRNIEKIQSDNDLDNQIKQVVNHRMNLVLKRNLFKPIALSIQEIQNEYGHLFTEDKTQGWGFNLKRSIIQKEISRINNEYKTTQ